MFLFMNRRILLRVSSCPRNLIRNGRVNSYKYLSTQHDLPTLRSVCRQFFGVIHPDLFAQSPEAKFRNEESLAIFLSYVEAWRKKPHGAAFSGIRKQKIDFYVKSMNENEEPRKITARLQWNGSYRIVEESLASLFAQAGIDQKFVLDKSKGAQNEEKMLEFLSTSIHAARSLKLEQVEFGHTIEELASELNFRSYQLDMDHMSMNRPSENVSNLSTLRDILLLPLDDNTFQDRFPGLKGATFLFAELERGVMFDPDAATFVLDKRRPDEWQGFLEAFHNRADVTEAIQSSRLDGESRKLTEHLETLQQVARSFLGVESITLSDGSDDLLIGIADDDEWDTMPTRAKREKYQQFLETIKIAAAGKRGGKQCFTADVNVRVRDLPDGKLLAITETGTLYMSPTVAGEQARQLVEKNAPKALNLKSVETQWKEVASEVCRRLGLENLCVSNHLYETVPNPIAKERIAIKRLYDNSKRLKRLDLKGLQIVISTTNKVSPSGDIHVKYDAEIGEVIRLLEHKSPTANSTKEQ